MNWCVSKVFDLATEFHLALQSWRISGRNSSTNDFNIRNRASKYVSFGS